MRLPGLHDRGGHAGAAGLRGPPPRFDAFIDAAGIHQEIASKLATLDPDDVVAVDAVSASIRDAITSRLVPPALRDEVIAAYDGLQARFDREVAVAVRPSATAEDLPGASFAGQQDTYLWVAGRDSVLKHVRSCWASLYTSRAILYRLKNGIPSEGLSIAVAVQKMVNSRASGVAITMNPTNGDRSKIIIDASYGVGEMVVSGQVTPDNVMVDKVTFAVVAQSIGDKHAELVPDFGLGRLVERPVDDERRGRRCLRDDEVTAVASMAKRAEKHFGCPQDIEWAFDSDLPDGANLLLLQSRPETVHSSRPAPAPSTTGSPHRQPRRRSPHSRPEHASGDSPAPLKSFPRPSELPVPPGADGWEKLYPYNLVFQDIRADGTMRNSGSATASTGQRSSSRSRPSAGNSRSSASASTTPGTCSSRRRTASSSRSTWVPVHEPGSGSWAEIPPGYREFLNAGPPTTFRTGTRCWPAGGPRSPAPSTRWMRWSSPRCPTWCRSRTSSRARPRTAPRS